MATKKRLKRIRSMTTKDYYANYEEERRIEKDCGELFEQILYLCDWDFDRVVFSIQYAFTLTDNVEPPPLGDAIKERERVYKQFRDESRARNCAKLRDLAYRLMEWSEDKEES